MVCSRMLTSSYPFKSWIPCRTPGVNAPSFRLTNDSMFCMMFSGVYSVVAYTSPWRTGSYLRLVSRVWYLTS